MVQDPSSNGHLPVDHSETNESVNYPGAGLTAAVETFEAFKIFHEKFGRLDPSQGSEYQKLVLDWNTDRHLQKYHPTTDLNYEDVETRVLRQAEEGPAPAEEVGDGRE